MADKGTVLLWLHHVIRGIVFKLIIHTLIPGNLIKKYCPSTSLRENEHISMMSCRYLH